MARKPEYRNPRTFSVTIEAEIKEEIDEFRGKLSYGKVFTMLWRAYKGEVVNMIELENLRKENEELKRKIRELERLVDRLQNELAKSGALSRRKKEAIELRDEIHSILKEYGEIKLIELFRKLGVHDMGEALLKKVETFLERWFVQDGRYYVSEELGIVIETSFDVGKLGWKVRRLERDDGKFRASLGLVEVIAHD
ncbi:hypothetical protein [Pyrococcus kukulkanii]|uniref:Uncharacterized protein n=1 Tax=Pyrococcus kukulkanii TaxID=1609559 RepID=A0ABV4T8W5_9EURY